MRSLLHPVIVLAAAVTTAGLTACGGQPSPSPSVPIATAAATSAPAATAARPAPAGDPRFASKPRSTRVILEGNVLVPTGDLLDVMAIGTPGAPQTNGVPDAELVQRDLGMLYGVYLNRGHLAVAIPPPEIVLAADGPFVDVRFRITHEGPRFRIGHLTIAEHDSHGKEVKPIGKKKLGERMLLRDGDLFARDVLLHDLDGIRRLYNDAGYADVEVDTRTELDMARATVEVRIAVRRNELTTMERIVIAGNRAVDAEVIRKELQVAEGMRFSETKLAETKRRLLALGVFSNVAISTRPEPSRSHITVTIEVEEK